MNGAPLLSLLTGDSRCVGAITNSVGFQEEEEVGKERNMLQRGKNRDCLKIKCAMMEVNELHCKSVHGKNWISRKKRLLLQEKMSFFVLQEK